MKILSREQKERIRLQIIRGCQEQTGYAGSRDPVWGCTYSADNGTPDRALVPKKCACLDLFSLVHRHADFGYLPSYFYTVPVSQIKVEDHLALDSLLADPESIWNGQWVYIWGDSVGCGKTTLAHLLVRRMYEWGKEQGLVTHNYRAWYSLSSAFGALASKWGSRNGFRVEVDMGNEEPEVVDLWAVNGPVVIDEFGREGTGIEATKAKESYEAFFRERIGLPTLVVGHLAPWDIQDAGITPQTISLMSTMKVVHVVGEDHRSTGNSPFYIKGH